VKVGTESSSLRAWIRGSPTLTWAFWRWWFV